MPREQLMSVEELTAELEADMRNFVLLAVVKAGGYEAAAAKYHRDDMVGVYARLIAARIYAEPELVARRLWPGTPEWGRWWEQNPADQRDMLVLREVLKEGKGPYQEPRRLGRGRG